MGNSFLQHGKEVLQYRTEWKTLLLLVLFDVLLVGALFAAAAIFDTIMALYETALVGHFGGYLLLFVYFILVTAAYSFFTYCALGFLTKGKKEKGVSFHRFGIFYLWTALLYATALLFFGALFLFFAYGLVSLLKGPALVIFSIAYWIIFYLYMQSSHVLFFLDKKLSAKELAKKAWTTFQWSWLWKWGLWNIVLLVVISLVYFGLFFILMLLGKNTTNYGLFYLFNIVVLVFLVLSTYFLFFWNRISVLVFVKNSSSIGNKVTVKS